LAKHHKAPQARQNANSLKASKDQVRSYLQKKKFLTRVYAPDNWVLKIRQRYNKFEPFYDELWAVVSCHDGNTYRIRSPGGIVLQNKYNGTNFFLAYVEDGHPVRSMWYASKQMLDRDRSRLLSIIRDRND
jgi:hypothetical protein